MVDYKSVSDQEWKKRLTQEQFYITRKKGTERAFTGYIICFFNLEFDVCYCRRSTIFPTLLAEILNLKFNSFLGAFEDLLGSFEVKFSSCKLC